MNKLKGVPPVIAGAYVLLIYPVYNIVMHGFTATNILLLAAVGYLIYELYKLIRWVAQSGLTKFVNMGV